jgi:hypothetical protein
LKKVGLVLILDQKKRKWEFVVVIHSLMFTDVKVPKKRIGEDGFGFAFAMNVLNGGRIGMHLKH